MRKLIFILFIVVPFLLLGQPGGGGGIIIHNIYDMLGSRIEVSTDDTYKLHCFLLKDTIFATTNIYSTLEFQTIRYWKDSLFYDSIYKRKRTVNVPAKFKAIKLSEISPSANYRMLLSNELDTMIVDFINVTGDNPIGVQSQIDSLVFQSGYYQYKKEEMYAISYPNDTLWAITYLEKVDFHSLSTSKNKSIKSYSKSRLKKQRKEYRKKVLKERIDWIKDPQRVVQKKDHKEKNKQLSDRIKKEKEQAKKDKRSRKLSSKKYKIDEKKAKKYRRKLEAYRFAIKMPDNFASLIINL